MRYFPRIIIFVFAGLQLLRLPSFPQFMDIYYHLQSAWGFIQAGGYSNWDFWEYAPFGRPNIYPPLFHILLALFMKAGAGVVLLAKLLEGASPVLFLVILWNFIRKNYGEELGFFVTVAFCSSFAFFTFLSNHIPASLALALGFLALGELFKKRVLRAVVLLVLCFYTHASVPWFFLLSCLIYGVMDKDRRRDAFRVILYSLLLSLPIVTFEFLSLPFIKSVGNDFPVKFHLQVKVFDYILAGFGLFLAAKMAPSYRLFIGLFLAGFIFLPYPYRFLSAEGYLPLILLAAVAMQGIWQGFKTHLFKAKRLLLGALVFFILFISPTVILDKPAGSGRISCKVELMDSALSGILLGKGSSIWFPRMYLPAVDIIKKNSTKDDIIYSGINFSGVVLGALAQRATSNALFPEVPPAVQVDPLAVANLVLLPKDLDEQFIKDISLKYKLAKVGESEHFSVFRNPLTAYSLKIRKAAFSLREIVVVLFILAAVLFWKKT